MKDRHPPLKVKIKFTSPCVQQNRLSPEALHGIQPVINSLLSQGILKESSPCNTAILPLPKPGTTDEVVCTELES